MKEFKFIHHANNERVYTGCYITFEEELVFVAVWRSDNGKRIDSVTYSEKDANHNFENGCWVRLW